MNTAGIDSERVRMDMNWINWIRVGFLLGVGILGAELAAEFTLGVYAGFVAGLANG